MALTTGKKLFCFSMIFIIIGISLLYCYSHIKNKSQKTSYIAANNRIIDTTKIISAMFPQKKFTKQGRMYYVAEGENYYIESMIPGTFVNKGNDELLVVIRRPEKEISHSIGFYQTYMAVFDISTGKMISQVKVLGADIGRYWVLDAQEISYIFFAGSRTFQGWTYWEGGLWKAGSIWTLVFPQEENYWKDKAIKFEENDFGYYKFNIFTRRKFGEDLTDYTWDYSYSLLWNKETASFKVIK